jgi:hypothetical protein
MRLWSDEGETTSAPPRPAAVCSEVRALLALPPETAEQTCARHAREREAALLARAQVEALREARYAAPPETWVKLALATPGPYAEQLLWGLGAMADDTVITAAREPLCVLPGAFCVWGDSDLPCAGWRWYMRSGAYILIARMSNAHRRNAARMLVPQRTQRADRVSRLRAAWSVAALEAEPDKAETVDGRFTVGAHYVVVPGAGTIYTVAEGEAAVSAGHWSDAERQRYAGLLGDNYGSDESRRRRRRRV